VRYVIYIYVVRQLRVKSNTTINTIIVSPYANYRLKFKISSFADVRSVSKSFTS
jgi:hypothetical protein